MTRHAKLTPKMLTILKDLAQPGAKAHYMPYAGRFREHPYYFVTVSHTTCTKQIEALLRRGFAERYDQEPYNGEHKVRITTAGRKALKRLENR